MPLQAGQMLSNRYRIVKLLGQGGFGAVYRAWDVNLSRPCAVKENLETTPEAQRQFLREATVLANLSHPNLPRVTDHFSIPEQGQYLVMDFVEGEDLATKLARDGILPIEQALAWVTQVADALTYLHSRQPAVVHRDIKPANIRVTPESRAMLVDFGLVKVSEPQMKTTIGARAVTPGYAPPEQYGQGKTDARTDVYALGATLYSMLTNQQPMDGLQRMMGGKMKSANQVNPTVPEMLGKVIERAMALEAPHRYQNAAEFKAALASSIATMPGSMSILPSLAPLPDARQAPEAYVRPVAQRPVAAPLQPPAQPVMQPQLHQQSAAAPRRNIAPGVGARPVAGAPAAARPAARARSKPRRSGMTFGVVALVILCIGTLLGAAVFGYDQWLTFATQTADAGFQETMDVRVQGTSTAQVEATALLRSTQTAEAEQTQAAGSVVGETEATLTAQARDADLTKALASRTLVLGPINGSLEHNPNDQLIAGKGLGVDLHNFILEMRFYNPYAAIQSGWDYGILFRYGKDKGYFRLAIRSDKTWALSNSGDGAEGLVFGEGAIPDLNVDEGGWNLIMLVCQGDKGQLYINKAFVDLLDLSSRSSSGEIYVVTGIYTGDEVEGKKTDYQDLTVWSIP